MKTYLLSLTLILFVLGGLASAQRTQHHQVKFAPNPVYRAKINSDGTVITFTMPDGKKFAGQIPEPPPLKQIAKQHQMKPLFTDAGCIYAFIAESCWYDAPSGFVVCSAFYWSEECWQGVVCYNWFGDCGEGCNLLGECVYGQTLLLN